MGGIDPVAAGDAVRARVPDVLRTYRDTRANVAESGAVERELKLLCARYLNGDAEVTGFERSERFDDRERAALGWAQAIAWDPTLADDALWDRLHRHFSEPELAELGYYMAIVHGQLHWLRALGIEPSGDEVLAP
jgi:alkylhydroperoxidase family enzyme